ncbi:hypothetical protein ACF0H5_024515 [Mactra antiquata]
MKTRQNGITFVTIATVLIVTVGVRGIHLPKLSRRFLLDTSTSSSSIVYFNNPCTPTITSCQKNCPYGLQVGINNCQLCMCRNPGFVTLPPSPTSGQSLLTQLPVSSGTSVTISVTNSPPTSQTTKILNQQNVRLTDPCIPSQTTCDKNCNGDYVKGPQGCQYCLCGFRIPPEYKTTAAPTSAIPSTPVPHYLDLTPTSEACIIAKLICTHKCWLGFISNPDDCLFCKCKSDVLDEQSDPTPIVYLNNPCVQGLTECGLTCPNGYISGPYGCEFCSCR